MRLGQRIHCDKHQASAENFKYNILDASGEHRLSRVSEALLLLFTQGDSHSKSKTHLIICAQKGLTAATRLLLQLDVDKNSQDNDGRTALHYAAENGDEGIVTLLVDLGAIKHIMDKHNKTALHLAIEKL
jgi:ankyrin repeat protein